VPKIRILVVDDAVVIRRLVGEVLNADPTIEVVGTAANGKIALAKLPQVSPDLVILDIEMPEMDGLATLREIRKTYPRLPVIMFSALTERGAAATLDALALGASDYFTKPTSTGGLEASLQVIRDELIPAIKALCGQVYSRVATAPTTTVARSPQPRSAHTNPVEVVAIGTSTGGPNALAEVFAAFPANFSVPIVLVQHMPPMFTRLLAERLTAQSRVKVEEGRSGGVLCPGHVWIAPGDYHMIAVRNAGQVRILIHQDPPENSCRPAVDVLFRSIALAFGPTALAVILTGMGQDGFRGCEAIREAGGQILAQDEATSVVWGMPGFVARAGLADRVLPLAMIAPEVVRRVQVGRGEPS
jgi:two-component system, chemotaxis family, protein-glutamate methylesterase/glutaminase